MDDGNEIDCKSTHGLGREYRNLWPQLRRCLHCHGRCCLKSIANVRMTHSRTIESMIIAETVLALSAPMLFEIAGKYAWSTPGPYESMVIAGQRLHCHRWCYLESLAKPRCRTIPICDYSWDGAHIMMGDAIGNRLQTYALRTNSTNIGLDDSTR